MEEDIKKWTLNYHCCIANEVKKLSVCFSICTYIYTYFILHFNLTCVLSYILYYMKLKDAGNPIISEPFPIVSELFLSFWDIFHDFWAVFQCFSHFPSFISCFLSLLIKLYCCIQVPSHSGFHDNNNFQLLVWDQHCMGVTRGVYKVLWKYLMSVVMLQPNVNEWRHTANKSDQRLVFPNCLGAVFGKHIILQVPTNSGSLFSTAVLYQLFSCHCSCVCHTQMLTFLYDIFYISFILYNGYN